MAQISHSRGVTNNVRRVGLRRPGPTSPNGESLGDLWYDTINLTLMVWNGTAWVGAATGTGISQSFGSLELRSTTTDTFIDFTRTPGTADYNVRLINDATNYLTLANGQFRTDQAQVGTYAWDNNWAHFGHKNRMNLTTTSYAFMHHGTSGETLVNSENIIRLRTDGANRCTVDDWGIIVAGRAEATGAMYASNWFRSYGATGWYNETHGGGIWMENEFIKTYGGKRFIVDCGLDGANWDDRSIRITQPSRSGLSLYRTGEGTATQVVSQLNYTTDFLNWNDAGSTCRAAAFSGYSAISGKSSVRSLVKQEERAKLKKVRPVRFRRPYPVRHLPCEGLGCDDCSAYGTPGLVNTPASDKTLDTDFVGFIAEEMAEVYPEVVTYEPSDREDPMSPAIPTGIDYGSLTSVLFALVQDLNERLEQLEVKK